MKTSSSSPNNYSVDSDNFDIATSVYEELIAWSVKLNSGMASAEDIECFRNWRSKDPMHEAAWQELYKVEQGLGTLSDESKHLAFETLKLADTRASHSATRRRAFKLLSLAAIATITATLFANQYAPWQQEAHYASGIGKTEKFLLADGTQLMLNTNTDVDVKFSFLKRQILLRHGEIYIDTGKDKDSFIGRRSFWVKTEQAELEAIGTRFSVKQQASSTKLHVVEGIVAMHVGNDIKTVQVYANETYTMPDAMSAPMKLIATNDGLRMDPMAWTSGMLVVKQMRLDEFVAELSRYQELPLICESNAGDLTVSGVFQLNQSDPVEHALKAIARTLPVHITKQGKTTVISKK